ncbi:NAD(P)-dependent oxidoreductase [Plantactinospora sp. KBS50]|uniref:NAD(P)-dependent oxidoreductase n=1 Tax=Plantactinospora sp. KBS50 TaxID=2024580 RepID=UPI0018DF93CA|nr:NAD(P)-dependent oxidoreductase [Plantactinospora sp. KBS50]
MTRIGFLGLGNMGAPMARRLVEAGHDVVVWNRSTARTRPLVAAGARAAATPAAAVADREVVVTMLADPAAVEAVFFGADGAAAHLAPGSLVVEMSTIGRDAVLRLRDSLPAEVRLVDAPVVGSVPQATGGQLRILLGGTPADVEAAGPALAAFGNTRHVGPLGCGAALKLVLNTSTISLFVLVGEALALADQLGLDPAETIEGLGATGMAPFLARIGDRIDDRDVPTYFGLGLAHKDLELALAAADGSGRPPRHLLAGGRDQLAAAVRAGMAGRDVSTVIHLLRGETGR